MKNANQTYKIDIYENLYSKFKENEDILNKDTLQNIKEFSREIKPKIEDAVKINRLLRIGIVGEVKAGKSTFLNALIFDGKQILPQAATPMTAALTKIVYSKNLKAEVEFYSKDDWSSIESGANDYDDEVKKLKSEFMEMKKSENINPFNFRSNSRDIENNANIDESEMNLYINSRVSQQNKGCYELIKMFYERNLDIDSLISKGMDVIDNISSIDDLMGRLEDYVGADGKYTPLVKSTKIYLNFDSLKGLEIIDTPGTNDPIVSRGITTRKYLSNCDVVFLLSYTGQFMKSQDVEFLTHILPNEGIKNAIIVGSKFDSAILDDNNSGNDFRKALALTSRKLSNHADTIVNKELEKDPNNKTLNNIKENLPPIFVSPMAYTISNKKEEELSENEAFILRRLKNRFSDFNFSNNMLRQFSFIDTIHNIKLKEIKDQKEEILKDKLENLMFGQEKKARNLILTLQKDVELRLNNLINSDKKHLDGVLNSLKKQSSKIENRVVTLFDNETVDINRLIKKLQLDIKSKYKDYDNLHVETKTSSSTSSSRGGFLWLKKTTTTTTTTNYEVKVKDAVDNIRSYAIDIEKNALTNFESIMNVKEIKSKLKKAVVELLDFQEGGVDEEQILNSIDNNLNKLLVPKLEINIEAYENMIIKEFSTSVVKNDDIHILEAKQRNVLVKISDDIEKRLTRIYEEIEKEFTNYSYKFISNVESTLEKDINEIKKQLENKEEFINRYNHVLKMIKEVKNTL